LDSNCSSHQFSSLGVTHLPVAYAESKKGRDHASREHGSVGDVCCCGHGLSASSASYCRADKIERQKSVARSAGAVKKNTHCKHTSRNAVRRLTYTKVNCGDRAHAISPLP
jgi:hypothetical protein